MEEEQLYKNRDLMLGEIHSTVKKLDKWCDGHDKKDDRRFLIGAVAILIIALATGVAPAVIKLLTGV